jgi:uncharacterized protein
MRLGLISDTHGFLDPRVAGIFAGVEHILHAGDIGSDRIIAELETVAPVTAVLGNNDDSPNFALTRMVELGGRKFLVHHIVSPRSLTDDLKLRIARERPAVVVFGHTHQPFSETINGVRFVNPGYAGKPKYGTQRSVAILESNGDILNVAFVRLTDGL